MITELKITDKEKTNLKNCSDDIYWNEQEIEFTSGLNVIIGSNGTGKSTLMNLIYSKYKLNDRLGGHQNFVYMNLDDGIELSFEDRIGKIYRITNNNDVDFTKLVDNFNHLVKTGKISDFKNCSSGESVKRQIESILSLCEDGDILLLDEPDKCLDIKNREWLTEILIKESETKQIITVLHDPIMIAILNNNLYNFIDLDGNYLDEVVEYSRYYQRLI
jgi:Predicted ATPase